jgi:hypothetical protein
MKKIIAAVVAALTLSPAVVSAAPPDQHSLTLVGHPVLGGQVVINYTTSAVSSFVSVQCREQGAIVYQESQTSWWDPEADSSYVFTLGPTRMWQSGDADCVASLYTYPGQKQTGRYKLATSISFVAWG